MNSQSLSFFQLNTQYLVLDVEDQNGDQFSERIMEMGLTRGSVIEIAYEAPFGGTLAIKCRGTLIAIRSEDAKRIKVRAL